VKTSNLTTFQNITVTSTSKVTVLSYFDPSFLRSTVIFSIHCDMMPETVECYVIDAHATQTAGSSVFYVVLAEAIHMSQL
jgi:hypothetical protein